MCNLLYVRFCITAISMPRATIQEERLRKKALRIGSATTPGVTYKVLPGLWTMWIGQTVDAELLGATRARGGRAHPREWRQECAAWCIGILNALLCGTAVHPACLGRIPWSTFCLYTEQMRSIFAAISGTSILSLLFVGVRMAPAVPTYAPRDPSRTVLYHVVAEHLETLLASLGHPRSLGPQACPPMSSGSFMTICSAASSPMAFCGSAVTPVTT